MVGGGLNSSPFISASFIFLSQVIIIVIVLHSPLNYQSRLEIKMGQKYSVNNNNGKSECKVGWEHIL